MNRVIRWMRTHNTPKTAAILDIGTGNGVFLVELVWHSVPMQRIAQHVNPFNLLTLFFPLKAKHGFVNLTGIDYSSASVELATNVLAEEGLTNIKVQVRGLHCLSYEMVSKRKKNACLRVFSWKLEAHKYVGCL